MMNEQIIKPVRRKEVAEVARQYYELMKELPDDWQSTFFAALEAWEREPILLQRIIDAEDMLEEAKELLEMVDKRAGMKELADAWLAKYTGEA